MSEPRLRAPKEHGQILDVPPFDQVAGLLERNRHSLQSAQLPTIGKSLDEIRSLARREILALSTEYHRQADEPVADCSSDTWLVSGHQPELFHPGVWFKNFALARLAKKHAATAVNLIIDTDSAKPALLNAPAGDHLARVPFDATDETAYEERRVVDEAMFASLPERMAPIMADWGFEPMLPAFWREVMAHARRTPLLGERFVVARRAFERRWGVTQREVPMSHVCATESFARFGCAILQDLPRFFAIYNETVRDYRRRHRIRSRNHPVPDLAADGDWREAPFWAWRSPGRRGKLFMRQERGAWAFRVNGETWPKLSAGDVAGWRDLQKQGYKIRPRALTTTMFARLFLADVFLHGIGGGIYDALTDRIIERYFGVSAPGFLIVSATLLLPLPRFADAGRRVHELARLQRDLVYKPERFVAVNETMTPLLDAKQEWIARPGANHDERVARFRRLREINAQLSARLGPRVEQSRREHAQAARQLDLDEIAARRDYAFCLFPEATLRSFFTADSAVLPF